MAKLSIYKYVRTGKGWCWANGVQLRASRRLLCLPASALPLLLWRLALLIVAFVFLYMFFGYYVAWQSPAVRQYYGGLQYSGFAASLKANWTYHRWIYPLQLFRALLYIVCLYPLIRMLRVARWEMTFAAALFLSVWTTALLLPNPMMPSSVARSHFWETLGFSLLFGALAGWFLSSQQVMTHLNWRASRHAGNRVA